MNNAQSSMKLVRKQRKQARGQVMALGAVTLVVLAFMTMLSFNVGNAIQQKIRLQAHSDAMAYSMAVTEARAFNYYAYSNRAIAAVLVAQSTLHGYHSIVSTSSSIMWAGAIAFFEIAAIEIGLCCSCPWCACFWHCIDAIEAVIVAFDYISKASDYADKIEGLESKFNTSVEYLGRATDLIHSSQTVMGADMALNRLLGNVNTYGMKDKNMKCLANGGGLPLGLGLANVNQYACALEGALTDPGCVATPILINMNGDSIEAKDARSKVMQEASNAARPPFDKSRSPLAAMFLHPSFLKEVNDVPGEGLNMPTIHWGGSRITKGTSESDCSSNSQGYVGKDACGYDGGIFTSVGYKHGVGAMVYMANIASDKQGGDHSILIGGGHTGRHDKYHGVLDDAQANGDTSSSCLLPTSQSNCFINFRANPVTPYFMQPKVFASYKSSMRDLGDSCNTAQPWEINRDGSAAVTIGDGNRGNGKLVLAPVGALRDAHALSKALVYFHRFDTNNNDVGNATMASTGGWKSPPNMFDPYWRAKLHPFDSGAEAAAVAGLAGDLNGAATAAIGPVEGN